MSRVVVDGGEVAVQRRCWLRAAGLADRETLRRTWSPASVWASEDGMARRALCAVVGCLRGCLLGEVPQAWCLLPPAVRDHPGVSPFGELGTLVLGVVVDAPR